MESNYCMYARASRLASAHAQIKHDPLCQQAEVRLCQQTIDSIVIKRALIANINTVNAWSKNTSTAKICIMNTWHVALDHQWGESSVSCSLGSGMEQSLTVTAPSQGFLKFLAILSSPIPWSALAILLKVGGGSTCFTHIFNISRRQSGWEELFSFLILSSLSGFIPTNIPMFSHLAATGNNSIKISRNSGLAERLECKIDESPEVSTWGPKWVQYYHNMRSIYKFSMHDLLVRASLWENERIELVPLSIEWVRDLFIAGPPSEIMWQ